MNIQDLALAYANRCGCDIKTATSFVKLVFEIVEEYVTRDKLVKIKGLGTFKLVSVSDRESINVNTGERIVIAGHTKLTFTPDASLKDAVNRPFADFETTLINDSTSLEDMERIPSLAESEDNYDDVLLTESEENELQSLPVNAQCDEVPAISEDSLGGLDSALQQLTQQSETELAAGNFNETSSEEEIKHTDTKPEEEVVDAETIEEGIEEESEATELENDSAEGSGDTDASEIDVVATTDDDTRDDASAEIVSEPTETVERKTESTSITPVKHVDISTRGVISGESSVYPMAEESLEDTGSAASKSTLSWWHILIVVVLMCASYAAGHFRVLDMLDVTFYSEDEVSANLSQNDNVEVQEGVSNTVVAEQDTLSIDTHKQDTVKVVQPVEVEEDPAEIAKYFPQVLGGEYWIVGDAGRVHYMQVGETLYGIARKELGDHNLIKYLIVFNKFEDPNIIHTGDPIRIPKLVKKVKDKAE